MIKTVLVVAAIVALFFLGEPVAKVAIIGGAFLLLTRRVKPEKIYREIDWPLLVMFVGLFIVVGGLEKAVIKPHLDAIAGGLHFDNSAWLAGATAVLSNIVSNVPAVLVLKPFIPNLPDARHAWLVVAMAATFAGNFTLVGSIANLIVAERAKAEGVRLDFWSYFKIGAPLTVVTLIAGVLWLGSSSPSFRGAAERPRARNPGRYGGCGPGIPGPLASLASRNDSSLLPRHHPQNAAVLFVGEQIERAVGSLPHVADARVQPVQDALLLDDAVAVER